MPADVNHAIDYDHAQRLGNPCGRRFTWKNKLKQNGKATIEKRVCETDKEAEVEGEKINNKKAKGKPRYQQQFKPSYQKDFPFISASKQGEHFALSATVTFRLLTKWFEFESD